MKNPIFRLETRFFFASIRSATRGAFLAAVKTNF